MKRFNRYLWNTATIIMLVLFGFSCGNKEGVYTLSPVSMLAEITSADNYLDAASLGKIQNVVFVDLRNPLDFEFNHHEMAVNIPAEKVMAVENQKVLRDIEKEGKMIVLYGATPRQAAGYWTQLKQVGIENIKVFNGTFEQLMKGQTASITLENEVPQIDTSLIKKVGNVVAPGDSKPVISPKITPRKASKPAASGGC